MSAAALINEARLLILILGVAGLFAGAAATSCSSPEDEGTLNSEPDFVGFVTMIEHDGAGAVVGHISVESHANKLVHRHVVTLTKQTALLRREGEALRPVDVGAFKLKDWVKLWFSGPRKEAYPLGVTARQLVIVDRP